MINMMLFNPENHVNHGYMRPRSGKSCQFIGKDLGFFNFCVQKRRCNRRDRASCLMSLVIRTVVVCSLFFQGCNTCKNNKT
jgi:hypothetical protein